MGRKNIDAQNLASSMNKILNSEVFQATFEKPQIKTASIHMSQHDNFSEEIVDTLLKCASRLDGFGLNASSKLILLATDQLIDEITNAFNPKDDVLLPPELPKTNPKPDVIVSDDDLIDMVKPEIPNPLNTKETS